MLTDVSIQTRYGEHQSAALSIEPACCGSGS
jgi:hypothetical protein